MASPSPCRYRLWGDASVRRTGVGAVAVRGGREGRLLLKCRYRLAEAEAGAVDVDVDENEDGDGGGRGGQEWA